MQDEEQNLVNEHDDCEIGYEDVVIDIEGKFEDILDWLQEAPETLDGDLYQVAKDIHQEFLEEEIYSLGSNIDEEPLEGDIEHYIECELIPAIEEWLIKNKDKILNRDFSKIDDKDKVYKILKDNLVLNSSTIGIDEYMDAIYIDNHNNILEKLKYIAVHTLSRDFAGWTKSEIDQVCDIYRKYVEQYLMENV